MSDLIERARLMVEEITNLERWDQTQPGRRIADAQLAKALWALIEERKKEEER